MGKRSYRKMITGAKAPPLKYLREWLEKNPCFDVDPKWANLVRAKGNLPENLKSRLMTSRRHHHHRIRDTLRHHSAYGDPTSMAAAAAAAAAQLNAFHYANPALLTNFPKMTFPLPFGTMSNLGMGNPLLSVPGLNLRNLASGTNLSVASLMEAVKDASDSGSDQKITSSTCTSSSSSSSSSLSSSSSSTTTTTITSSSSSSTTTPHPSFPVLYNPIIYNTLLAANNFNIPATVPSLTSLAKGDMSNGLADIDDSDSDDIATRTLTSTTAVTITTPTTTSSSSSTTVLKKPSTAATATTKVSTSSLVATDNGSDNSNMEAEDLSIKKEAEERESPSLEKGKPEGSLQPKLIIKTKPKIQQSSKLSRIVDSLKDKVKNLDPLRAKKEYSQEKTTKEIIDSTHSGNSKSSIITTTTTSNTSSYSNTTTTTNSSSSSSNNMQSDNREPEKTEKTKES